MLAFEGTEVPEWLEARLRDSPPAGVTLFREWNMTSPEQTAELTSALQQLNSGPHPLLIAVDQEGGQLTGITGSTPFAGNMALGATGDVELAAKVAERMGREMAALGINLNYAPVADLSSRADNPSTGVRSFGEDPEAVARLTAATVRGLTSAEVLAAVKHFPGQGDISVDPHYELPVLDLDDERLEKTELRPFRAAVKAGVGMVMIGHYVVPALTGSRDTPIFASEQGIDFIRDGMGFDGVVLTDALDMGALDQGPNQAIEVVAMMRAGVDLLMCMPDPELQQRVRSAVERGYARGLIPDEALAASRRRVDAIRKGLHSPRPDPAVVGGSMDLAMELAEKSVTVVRNDAGLLPLRPDPGARILALQPAPSRVTPADTSNLYPPGMAQALRGHHDQITEIVYPQRPRTGDISRILTEAAGHDLVIAGTVNAGPEQAALVNGLLQIDTPVVTVALRAPYDLTSYPASATHLCTYTALEPSMAALARILFEGGGKGRLPVGIPGLHPLGHGLGT
jgi:beta-N-acetylhexosaminidase